MDYRSLNTTLGNIDIYLLDQVLKGRLENKKTVLDVGCGEGRNLVYLAGAGYDVYGYDIEPSALLMLKYVLKGIDPSFDERKLIEGNADSLPLPTSFFDFVISSAVLHFSSSTQSFLQQVCEMHRVLSVGGILFIRMTSNIGLPLDKLKEMGNGRFMIPDGSTRFLLTRELIKEISSNYDWKLIEPVKTTLVEDVRSMTTLVFRKS
jgi:tellurite methyltransferase